MGDMEGRNQGPFDIENPQIHLATSIRNELDSLAPLSSVCCIYRVSERLRLVNEKAYTPQVVSIGPLHHGKEGLKAMEEHKKWYLRDYLERTKVSLEEYIYIIKKKEKKLRSCYAQIIGFDSDEFVKIILVDSAFIIEVLLRYNIPEFQDEHDRIFNKPWMLRDAWLDLLLLENQLPFFILEDLFDPKKITVSFGHTEQFSIIKLSHRFFKSLMHLEGTEENLEKISSTRVEHFVDFLRKLYIPLQPRNGGQCKSLTTLSVMELQEAGVRFKVQSTKNIFDIQFVNGILKIPKFTINDETEQIIRNLLAFEQSHCIENCYLNDYIVIMDLLVNTSKDVDLLVKFGIVENKLGDNSEVSHLINRLADGVVMDSGDFYFAKTFDELNAYCRTSWHKWKASWYKWKASWYKWKATFKQKYFHTPWAIFSVLAAILLILLTIIQAVCSILSVI